MDRMAPLPKDPFMAAANRTAAEWQKKTKEVERKKKQQKLQARERGEETDSDDNDDDDEEDDEVVTDTEWGDLGDEDTLTGTHSSMQGPFLFHAREGAAMRSEEAGWIVGLSLEPLGAGGSTTKPKVPVKGSGPTAVPRELAGVGGSTAAPKVLAGAGRPVTAPQEPAAMGGSAAAPEVSREGSGSATVPQI